MPHSKTDVLRAAFDARGIIWTAGYTMRDGRIEDEDTVTCAWPVPDDSSRTTTFEEGSDGELWVADDVTVAQAVALVMAGEVE